MQPLSRYSNSAGDAGAWFTRVLDSGLCVGCGLCAGFHSGAIEMTVTPRGEYQPAFRPGQDPSGVSGGIGQVCPFSGAGDNEDVLARREFAGQPGIQHSPQLGYYLRTQAAWVTDESARIASSAGGLGTWLARYLLKHRMVDGVCCVTEGPPGKALFEYRIVRREEDLAATRKSKYYPVEMSKIIGEMAQAEGRYAVVSLPCFAKGLRLAMQAGLLPREKIFCIIGLFCGHQKTRQFAHYLIRSCGFHEKDTVAVDFRKKVLNDRASEYAFEATIRAPNGETQSNSVRMREVALGNWGLNSFMLKACECCDDVVAELADISLGDAWLPEFVLDGRGTNLVISRRVDLAAIVDAGVASGGLAVKPLSPEAIVAAQDGAFRQRRQALAYRLYLAQKHGDWRPAKRVLPDGQSLKLYSKLIQHLRLRIAESTKNEFLRHQHHHELSPFLRSIRPLLIAHHVLHRLRAAIRRWGVRMFS
jgi:coenzyme F420-reducing hydrogenase beta subunit